MFILIVSLLVSLVSLIVWGKVSKEQLESNIRASFVKTCLYFCGSIVVFIIFIKTYQVAINNNTIIINKIIGLTNEGKDPDSVGITIYHRMAPKDLRNLLEYDEHIKEGGFKLSFVPDNRGATIMRDTSRLLPAFYEIHEFKKIKSSIPKTNFIHNVIRRYDEELGGLIPDFIELLNKHEQYKNVNGTDYPNYEKVDSNKLITAFNYIFEDCSHLFNVLYFTTKEQSILPYESHFKSKPRWETDSLMNYIACIEDVQILDSVANYIYYDINGERLHLNPELLRKLNLHNTPAYKYLIGVSKYNNYFDMDSTIYTGYKVQNQQPIFNTVNFLTASDLSQRIFEVNIHSEMPIWTLDIYFDVPIEISGIYPQPDIITMRSIHYKDREKLNYLQSHCLDFHAKLPTFENKQLVRSLLITTILLAIVSLFSANLYVFCSSCYNKIKIDNIPILKIYTLRQLKEMIVSNIDRIRKNNLKYAITIILKFFLVYVILRILYLYIIYAYGNPLTVESKYSFLRILWPW